MPFYRQAQSPKFSQHQCLLFDSKYIRSRHLGVGIMMNINDIACVEKIAAACFIDQPGRIHFHRPLGDLFGFKLSPCFIERHPCHYGRKIITGINDRFPFFAIDRFGFRGAVLIQLTPCYLPGAHIPGVASHITTGHILPYQHAQLIAVIVPACGLYLYMLADHVEPDLFGFCYIKFQCFIRGSGI